MSELSATTRDLIARHFDSAESVEIVLLLRRSPETFWSPTAIAQQLGIREDAARQTIVRLAESRIIVPAEQSDAFRYAPADDAMRAKIDGLAADYADHRFAVIDAIYSQNLRTFSNAFRWKKE